MKIGDLVVRSYSHEPVYTGIIVSEVLTDYGDDEHWGQGESYIVTSYNVLWADGSQTSEMYEELDYAEDVADMWWRIDFAHK